jgi:acyl carrier protein
MQDFDLKCIAKPVASCPARETSPRALPYVVKVALEATMLNQQRRKGNSSMQDVLSRVQKAFESAFHIDPQTVTIDSSPEDIPAWDSMGHVELASSLERTFGLTFDVDDLMEMENVKEILRIVQSKLEKVPSAQVQ